ncbi:MAG: hypothetical protein WAT19_00385 [Ferruginibacter sp.]
MKKVLLFIYVILLISCKKESILENKFEKKSIKSESVNEWLLAQKGSFTPVKNKMVENIIKNMDYSKMWVEVYNRTENFTVIPILGKRFSQHIFENKTPLQYLLLVTDKNGEIRRGDLVFFYAFGSNTKELTPGSFYDFYKKQSFPHNGTYQMISLGDIKRYEFDFFDKKILGSRIWLHESSQQDNITATGCTDWYMVTTTYYANGTTIREREYVGTTCEGGEGGCPPTYICDNPSGSGGSTPPPDPGYFAGAEPTSIVYSQSTNSSLWEVRLTTNLIGQAFNDPSENYFYTNSQGGSVRVHYGTDGAPNQPYYVIYNPLSYVNSLSNYYKTAYAAVNFSYYYPNWPGGSTTPQIRLGYVYYDAAVALH